MFLNDIIKIMSRLRKLLMVLLLLILPVQGFAAAYAPIHKALGSQGEHGSHAAAVMPCHEQPAASHANHQPVTDGDTDSTSHLCCQQVFTGATSSAWPSPAHKFSDVSLFVLPLFTLFIPDSPDRPPRG